MVNLPTESTSLSPIPVLASPLGLVDRPLTVCYVAKHDSGGNDDEGAITQALLDLGHRVERLRESRGAVAYKMEGDFLLFHKWEDIAAIRKVKLPKVFWYFDLVDWPGDPLVAERCRRRRNWMEEVIPLVDMGFCTDGDWVQNSPWGRDKLRWLPQGADLRVMGFGEVHEQHCPVCRRWWGQQVPLLFTGTYKGGCGRQSFIKEMQNHYGADFLHIPDGVHGRDMANLVATAQIVLAPDYPVTDRYWSNRVYNALGFGAFLLHPYCAELARQYEDRKEVVYYRSRADLFNLIQHYRASPEERLRISKAGLNKTISQHTYHHRVASLIEQVRQRLSL